MLVVKIITVIISGYASLFVIAWTMIVVSVGLSWVVSWQDRR